MAVRARCPSLAVRASFPRSAPPPPLPPQGKSANANLASGVELSVPHAQRTTSGAQRSGAPVLPGAAEGLGYPLELRVYVVMEFMDRGNLQVGAAGGVLGGGGRDSRTVATCQPCPHKHEG